MREVSETSSSDRRSRGGPTFGEPGEHGLARAYRSLDRDTKRWAEGVFQIPVGAVASPGEVNEPASKPVAPDRLKT
jgi:hypothetical protein